MIYNSIHKLVGEVYVKLLSNEKVNKQYELKLSFYMLEKNTLLKGLKT